MGRSPSKAPEPVSGGRQDDEEKGVSKGRCVSLPAPKFGGCPSALLRVRDAGNKYAGDRKTEPLRPDDEAQMAASLSSRFCT